MADGVLNLILKITKGGSGDKDAVSGLAGVQKFTKTMLRNVRQDAKLMKGTIDAVAKGIGEAFELAAKEAEKLGRSEVTASIDNMNDSFKQITDTLVQIPIGGRDFLAWMGDAADGAANLGKTVSALGIFLGKMTGQLDDQRAAILAGNLVRGEAKLTTEQLAQAQKDLANPMDESNRLMRDQAYAAEHEKYMLAQTAAAAADLATIMGGELGKENKSFTTSQAELSNAILKTESQIRALTAANGAQVTITNEAKYSTDEFALAQLEAADAAQKAAEYTGDDIQQKLQLQIAAQKAADEVAEMSGALGSSTTATINNQKAINELNGTLAEQQAAMTELVATHEAATARIVFGFVQQRLAADGLQDGEIAMLGEIGKAWGLYDETTANALSAVDSALATHSGNAQQLIDALGQSIRDLPDSKTIRINVVNNGAGLAGGGQGAGQAGFAGGGSFMVGGSGGTDSQPVAFMATPGERVTIQTPAQQASNTTNVGGVTININGAGDPSAVAREVARQLGNTGRSANNRGRA